MGTEQGDILSLNTGLSVELEKHFEKNQTFL